jgi:predicted DNA-binding transcriptional regulator AlpA
MDEQLLRLGSVMDMTGFRRSKIYSLIAQGRFPPSIKVEGCACWPRSRVSAWIAEQIAASDQNVP